MEGIPDPASANTVELYMFNPYRLVFSVWDLRSVYSSCPHGVAAIALGRVKARIECYGGTICVDHECFQRVEVNELDERKIYMVFRGELKPVEVRGENYVVLKLFDYNTAPTVEIDGIHMHRVEEVDPWRDTLLKIKAARVKRGHRVLDICTGLGYTAIASLEKGAVEVITIEVNEAIVWVAERNPWSWRLSDNRVKLVLDDATRAIKLLPDNYFDRVVHDPPRFTAKTGDLYSTKFYGEIYRVMKPGAILYHYLGEPGKRRGLNLYQSVKRRLLDVGFELVKWIEEAKGVIARKPRTP